MIILNPLEMLEIYLTERGLKPACLLGRCLTRKGVVIEERSSLPEEFRELLKSVDKPFNEKVNIYYKEIMLNFYVGRNQRSLDRLLYAKTDDELGLALGYPLDAVVSYLRYIDGELRAGTYINNQVIRAIKAGIQIPSWIDYISHVPKYLDLVNGRISESSETQGRTYESYVKRNNPSLAEKLQAQMETWIKKLSESEK
jgi:hypothetical protein